MPTLLHIDDSPAPNSNSRAVAKEFADAWRQANPDGRYRYRDLAAQQVPPADREFLALLDLVHESGARTLAEIDALATTEELAAAWAVTRPLAEELLSADTVLISTPMYNLSVPATLKAWLDRFVVAMLAPDPETGQGPLVGKRVVVVTARGGAYGPGTPREGFDFQEPYLRAFFGILGLDGDLTFVHTELTMAHKRAAMADLRELAASNRITAAEKARSLGAPARVA